MKTTIKDWKKITEEITVTQFDELSRGLMRGFISETRDALKRNNIDEYHYDLEEFIRVNGGDIMKMNNEQLKEVINNILEHIL